MKKFCRDKDTERYIPKRCAINVTMMSLNHILRKSSDGYKLSKSQEKIKHFMYMDGIGMEFGIEKCVMLCIRKLEADTIKHGDMKEEIDKEYIR